MRGGALGLAAAALFGMSAPFAKLLLPGSSPLMLAALLYLGAGVALTLFGAHSTVPSLSLPSSCHS